jgi:DNA repair protein RadC
LRDRLVTIHRISTRLVRTSSEIDSRTTLEGILRLEFSPHLEPQENVWACFLTARSRIIRTAHVYKGTVNQAYMLAREILYLALSLNAVGVVVAHNHPSGDPVPSDDDISSTKQLQQALAICQLKLVDHLIFAGGDPDRSFSFKENKLL